MHGASHLTLGVRKSGVEMTDARGTPAPMRILEVFQPPDGGIPEHVLRLSEGLAQRGVRCVVAGPPDGDLASRAAAAGARWVELELVGRVPSPGADLHALASLRRLLAVERFDLVHAHGQKAGIVARWAAWRAGVPVVYTPHSFVYRTQLLRARRGSRLRHRATRALERGLGSRSAAIVAVAAEERDAAITDRIAPAQRIRVIANGVEPDAGAAPDPGLRAFRGEGPLLGLVAGLRDQKGLPTLLDALELLAGERRAPRFAIVGNGPLRGYVEARVRDGPLAATTRVAPFAGRVEPYLAALDAFVLPSYWEGMPIAVLEAMAMGLPVVASAVGGTPEAVLEGETGWLVPPRDPRALARALAAAAGDEAARRRMGERGRQVAAERFTVARMVAETLALYAEVAGR